MVLVDNGPITITRDISTTLFEASSSQLPGIFSGKIRPQGLSAGDILEVKLHGKTTPNNTEDVEVIITITNADDRFFLTPLEAVSWYRISVTLTGASQSVSLDYEITRGAVS